MSRYSLYDRILGSLVTAGMGDAIGAPSEAFSQAEILEHFGGYITKFEDGGTNAYALGNFLAEVTDDASQMYEMAKAVIETNGELTVDAAANALVTWSKSYPKYYPRNAGPTTSYVIKEIEAGSDPVEIGKVGKIYGRGTSNGAAMRVAAAGLCNPGDIEGAIKTAVTMTKPSHGTHHAYSGACAIAAGIAVAICEDSNPYSILKAVIYGAKKGEDIGRNEARVAAGPRVIHRITKAIEIGLDSECMDDAIVTLEEYLGNDGSIQGSVSVAVGLFATSPEDAAGVILGGANVGGDTDTIACIAGMLAGAYKGFNSLPDGWYDTFKKANPTLEFKKISKQLDKIAKSRLKK